MESIMSDSLNHILLKYLIDKNIDGFKQVCYNLSDEKSRSACLSKFALFCVNNLNSCAGLAQHFIIYAKLDRQFFEFYLFQFLTEVYRFLVLTKKWDDALELETSIYNVYIKQDETDSFYQRAFDALYSVYDPANLKHTENNTTDIKGSPTLYFLMNFNKLAHVEVLLEYFSNLEDTSNVFLSALSSQGLESLKDDLDNLSINYFTLSNDKKISIRYQELIKYCIDLGINNIVFISLPLHSNYVKQIVPDKIKLTWWSMKFPLGGMRQFSRLVCCRSMVPELRNINGELWSCAPFAVKGITTHARKEKESSNADINIKFGVLAREEKFASSRLPEVVSKALLATNNSSFYWTGRSFDLGIHERITSSNSHSTLNRSHFVGWVNPIQYLNDIDVFVDTPNLGGVVAYWAMSLNKIVISSTDSGSIGALASKEVLAKYFLCLSSETDVNYYFSNQQTQPFYLSDIDLIFDCFKVISSGKVNITEYGILFGNFFQNYLTNFNYSANCIESMIRGDHQYV
jgi:hypothetical protein